MISKLKGWIKTIIKEVIENTEFEVDMVDGKPVGKIKFKKEI